MHIKLWHKFALILASVSAIILLVALYFSQQSFKRGFLEYLNSQERERIDYVIEQLTADYSQIGGWSFVQGPPEKWQAYLQAIFDKANSEGLFPELHPERKLKDNRAGLYRADSEDKRFRLPLPREAQPAPLPVMPEMTPSAPQQQPQPRPLQEPQPQQRPQRFAPPPPGYPPPAPPKGFAPQGFPPPWGSPPPRGFSPPRQQGAQPSIPSIPGISNAHAQAGQIDQMSTDEEIKTYILVPSEQVNGVGKLAPTRVPVVKKKQILGPRPLLKVALENEENKLIAGAMDKNGSVSRYPVLIRNQPAGFLVVKNVEQFANNAQQEFIAQQSRIFSLIAILSIVLISLLAWWLGRVFNTRIIPLSEMAHQLTDGDFDRRLALSSNDELGQLSQDLNQLAVTLEQNRNSRQRWIADISHELRTPISILRGELEALLDGIRPLQPEAIESLQTEALRLTQLVEDLYQLTMADVGALSYQFEQLNLIEVLKQELGSFKRQLKAHPVSVRLHSKFGKNVYINGDRTRLGQLFKNLIQNTLRYTDAPGELLIEVSSVQSGELTGILLRWSDSPPGVADNLYNRLFERMLRAEESRNRETGGAGLGLAIVEQIVVAHQGKVKARPSPLGGLSVEIIFPLTSSNS